MSINNRHLRIGNSTTLTARKGVTPDSAQKPLSNPNRCSNANPAHTRILFIRAVLVIAGWLLLCFRPVSGQVQGIVGRGGPTLLEVPKELQAKWSGVGEAELKRAADSGNADAEYLYAVRELTSAKSESDRGNDWLFKAVANGENLSENEKAASESRWSSAPEAEVQKAAQAGDRDAQWFLGRQEVARAQDRGRKAIDWIKRAAEHSQATAAFELGQFYIGEKGWRLVPVSIAEGVRWLNSAANARVEAAQHKLADLYIAGSLVSPDLVVGIGWLQKAADQGCKRAQFELACHYANGDAEPRSGSESPTELLVRSATNGHLPAIEAMANRYRSGFGVPQDYVRAIQWYGVAAQLASTQDWGAVSHAQEVLALVSQDLRPRPDANAEFASFAEVMGLYLKATTRKDPEACLRIGELYRRGHFEPMNLVEAYRWCQTAAQRGRPPASRALEDLKQSMTPEQLDEATRKGPVVNEEGKLPAAPKL